MELPNACNSLKTFFLVFDNDFLFDNFHTRGIHFLIHYLMTFMENYWFPSFNKMLLNVINVTNFVWDTLYYKLNDNWQTKTKIIYKNVKQSYSLIKRCFLNLCCHKSVMIKDGSDVWDAKAGETIQYIVQFIFYHFY